MRIIVIVPSNKMHKIASKLLPHICQTLRVCARMCADSRILLHVRGIIISVDIGRALSNNCS